MLLQSCLQNRSVSFSSSHSYSRALQGQANLKSKTLIFSPQRRSVVGVTCSISQVHSYGTTDYERRQPVKWNALYRKISLPENQEVGAGAVLTHWERQGNQLSKWELCRVIKELRKYKRFARALEVYIWMNNRGERFRLSSSDAAIQLDLIGKVHGIASAENFFLGLSDSTKDRRIYGALLNSYARSRKKEKAESLLDQMRAKRYATHCLPFNVIMTLYMNLNDYEKVEAMISEMKEKNIQLDVYSYNIWLSCRGSQGSAESMEQVYELMRQDLNINPNWTTFSTMATMYIKMGMLEKANDSLKRVESRITGRDRIPFHYLISLYGSAGNRDEIYRVWNVYKGVFPTIPNLGFHAVISSLLRIGDVEGAEEVYAEWLPIKTSYDPRIANLFMVYFAKTNLEKAINFADRIVEGGGKPNSGSWEALAEGYTREKKIPEALFYWKEAFAAEGAKNWRPKPVNVCAFLDLCGEEADLESREVLMGLMQKAGTLKDEFYAFQVGLPHEVAADDDKIPAEGGSYAGDGDENKETESEMLLNQL